MSEKSKVLTAEQVKEIDDVTTATVKTSVGDFEIGKITWRQIKEARIFGLVKKIMESGTENIMDAISDDDIDRVVGVVAGDKKDQLTFSEVMEIFNAVLSATSLGKS